MFHHEHRIAQVAQVGEGPQQSFVVALVQADRGFVEDVHDSNQAGTNLAGQPDPLRLAAGEGVCAAIQGEVVEANVDQELQAGADLLLDLVGDLATATGELQTLEVVEGTFDRAGGDGGQVHAIDEDVARCLGESGAAAVGTISDPQVLLQVFTHHA